MPAMTELLARFGSPLYVYDLSLVRERARSLLEHITYRPFQPQYALKANSCPAVVATILGLGYGIDAVSPGEVAMALRLGLSPGKILFTENNMTDQEMAQALAQDVVINCGSLDRLQRLGAAGARSCAVRFNPDVGAGAHAKICTGGPLSKFGINYQQVDEVLAVERSSGMQVVGCHMHIGSGILDAEVYVRAMKVLLGVAVRLPNLRWINFGGGLGIPYKPTDLPLPLDAFGRSASDLMSEFAAAYAHAHQGRRLELRLEPGRFLVAEAGTLLTTVTSVKTNPDSLEDGMATPGRTFVGCDTGFNHLVRPAMYGAYHRIENLTRPQAPKRTVDVVGNICESGDIFATDYHLPEAQLGDCLALRDAGAYGMAMASTYNLRPLPAEVAIDGATVTLVRKRQELAELLDAWEWGAIVAAAQGPAASTARDG